MINLNILNPVIFYSPYGYIQVDKNEYYSEEKQMIYFYKKYDSMSGTIKKDLLKEIISIKCKTFYGRRRTFTFDVNIHEKLLDIIMKITKEEDKLCENEKDIKRWNYSNQFRLVSSNGRIKELNPSKTYAEELIGINETIILLNQVDLYFSDAKKGNYIYLENRSKIALKQGGDELQYVLTEQAYSRGKNYCEFILETEPYERSVILGVSLNRTEFTMSSGDIKGFWGFVLSECKKISNNSSGKAEAVEYGDITKIGDRVGIMIEFHATGMDLTFYINKINMGVAFKNIPLGTYYPTAVLGYDGTKVRITNKVGYPDV